MRAILVLSLLILCGAVLAAPASWKQTAADPQWQRWLMPLPKQVSIEGKVTVPLSRLDVGIDQEPTELDRNLRRELLSALYEKAGVKLDLTSRPSGEAFVLVFASGPRFRDDLGDRPHCDQAYCIRPVHDVGTGDYGGLECAAVTDAGCYFAMKTLKQLMLPTVRGHGAEATVDVPMANIVDWPDMEERGQWGGTAADDLDWLSDLKFNLLERHATLTVDKQGVGHAEMDAKVMAAARAHGVRVVPIIHHLEQLVNVGLFEAYPMIVAKDADTGNPGQRSICFSRPEIVKPLTDWLTDLGKIKDVSDVMIWLSEEGKGCGCEQCKQADRYVLEMNACVKAWRAAKQTCPNLGLRLLLTQGSYPSNAKVLAALPTDVKVSYYHGGLTYNTERKPMIYPVLETYLRQKRWMGVYPTLSANWLIVAPFSNPEFTRYRLTEFVDKGLQNLVGYIVPTDWYFQVNTDGGLEWSWNAHGRSPHEFALSFAVRHGLKDPDAFARWTEAIGPVAWDLYASNWPFYEYWGDPAVSVAAGKAQAPLGGTYFLAYPTEAKFVQNLARCDEALKLAEKVGEPQFLYETKIVRGYTQVLQAVHELNKALHGAEKLTPEEKAAAEKWFAVSQEALDTVTTSYPEWSRACQPQFTGNAPDRFSATVTLMERLDAGLGDLRVKVGLVDPNKAYRLHTIGGWKTEEFAKEQAQVRRLDVSGLVDGVGKYQFRPVYHSGTLGLSASQVALVSSPKDKPDEVREEGVDKHVCHAGAWIERDIYTVELTQYDLNRGYAIMASIHGGDSTVGDFLFRKVRK